jgi:DnaJ-class molecular chaperone
MSCEEKSTCSCCGGTGRIHEALNDDGDMESDEECQCCDGTGER